jgi:DNA-binding GntR family transcriptional regulator
MNAPLPSKPLPLYIQISEMLSREILAGHWRVGERIPTEPELSVSRGVASGTLRKAVAELEQRGVLERKQGSGTYVRGGRKAKNIYEFFRLELLAGGGLPTAQILGVDQELLPDGISFGGSSAKGGDSAPASKGRGKKGYRIRRLRLLNGVAVALEEIWIDMRHKKNLQAKELTDSLYLFYKNHFGFWVSKVEDHIGVDPVPDWAPEALALPPHQPCTFIERYAWSNANAIEEYSRTWVNPRQARYSARWH